MKRIALFLFAGLLVLQAKAQVPAALAAHLQDTLEQMQLRYGVKGMSAAAGYKDRGIWKSAVGVSAAGTALSPDMLIGIGSNTKTFVGALLVRFSERGLLSLSDTIGTWISGYPNIKGSATIRQVLNHTSGFNNYTDNPVTWDSINKDLGRIWTKEEILNHFVAAPSFAPGLSWQYSNTNYIIAGLIAEQVGGRPIHELLRDSVMVPAGLNHTFFPPFETPADPYAHLWTDWDGDGKLDDVGEYSSSTLLKKEVNSIADAAGALVSTAEDNVRFWQALMRGAIISMDALRNDMLKWTGFGSPLSEYGLGIFRSRYLGRTIFSHGGTWIGQINENLADTSEQIYITVLSNQDSLQNDVMANIVKGLYKVMLDYRTVGLEQQYLAGAWTVYPNPARDYVSVRDLPADAVELLLLDSYGRQLRRMDLAGSNGTVSLQAGDLAAGNYFLQLRTASGTGTARMISIIH